MSSTPENTILVLISGSGTNLQALMDACHNGSPSSSTDKILLPPNTRVSHVISNRKSAYGLERARQANIATTYHNLVAYRKRFPDTEDGIRDARDQYDADLAEMIVREAPTLVVCAGWMHILSEGFVARLKKEGVPVINLHPALPGAFNGAEAIGRAWRAFQRGEITGTGVMVHYVIGEVDMGEPIVVREVKCLVGESESELEERIHRVEWEVIVEGTRKALEAKRAERVGDGKVEKGDT